MSYENENEIVITSELFKNWCSHVNGNKASMKQGDTSVYGKPLYYLNTATGTKTQIKSYEFKYDPEEFGEGTKTYTATATYVGMDGKKITSHAPVPQHPLNK